MTRPERIQKLTNAIRRYRGITSTPVGASAEDVKWKIPPKKSAVEDVTRWLQRLNLPVKESLEKSDGFKCFPEFHGWIKGI